MRRRTMAAMKELGGQMVLACMLMMEPRRQSLPLLRKLLHPLACSIGGRRSRRHCQKMTLLRQSIARSRCVCRASAMP